MENPTKTGCYTVRTCHRQWYVKLSNVAQGTTEIHSHATSLPSVPVFLICHLHLLFVEYFSASLYPLIHLELKQERATSWEKSKTAIYEHKLHHY